MVKRQEAMQAAAARLPSVLTEGSELLRYAYLMLFGHRMTRWAASKICEDPKVSSPMIQIINDAQMEKSGEPFDFYKVMKDFTDHQMGWIDSIQRKELTRSMTNKKRVKNLAVRLKSKYLPLPSEGMAATVAAVHERSITDGGMTHEDTLLIFGPREAYLPLLRLCAKLYAEAGGVPLTLLGDLMVPDDLTTLPGLFAVNNVWRNSADTFGSFAEIMKPFKNSSKNPIGLLVVEGLDGLLAESPLIEPRPVRLVRALGMLRQYQATYPMAMIIGIDTTDDKPEGMRPEEVYPPFITSHPYVEVEVKVSDLSLLPGAKNIIVKSAAHDDELFTQKELWKKVALKDPEAGRGSIVSA